MTDLTDLFETGLQDYFKQQNIVYVKKNELVAQDAASVARDIDFKDLMLPSRNYEKEMEKLMEEKLPETESPSAFNAEFNGFQKMCILFMNLLPRCQPELPTTPPATASTNFLVFVKTLTGKVIPVYLESAEATVEQLKVQVEIKEGIPKDQQRLIHSCKQLDDDDRSLASYSISPETTVHLLLRLRGGGCMAFTNAPDKFDPKFHFDFTNVSDNGREHLRGGLPYIRPTGSKRMAIKVLGAYEDDDWIRSDSDGDWAVAYHGSTDPRTEEIVKCGGLKEKYARRTLYGTGIYCTPDPATALAYAKEYTHQGSDYKMIVQTRVDTKKIKVIPKSQHGIKGLEDYWVVPEDSIRMYGLCAYEIN